MRLPKRLLTTASAVTMFAVPLVVGSFGAGAAGMTFDVSNDHVTCDTTLGSIGFNPPLTVAGPTSGVLTTTLKMSLADCTDTDNGSITPFSGSTTMSLSSNNGSNCSGLLGPINDDGESQIVWKAGAGQAFAPKDAGKSVTNIHFFQEYGDLFTTTGHDSWTSPYGLFEIGTTYGTAAPSSTLDFTGGDGAAGGAASWLTAVTSESLDVIVAQCASPTGLPTMHIGIGATHWGGTGVLPANSSTTTSAASLPCSSPTVTSADGSTSLQVTAVASAQTQTLTLQVGTEPAGPFRGRAKAAANDSTTLVAMQCTLAGSVSVISGYHTTAPDAAKTAQYIVTGTAGDQANTFYDAHTGAQAHDIAGCYGSPVPFNGWLPSSKKATWAKGPYTYHAATRNASTGLYEAFLGSCANHGGYVPCFVDTNDPGTHTNTLEVHSPPSVNDPRVSH